MGKYNETVAEDILLPISTGSLQAAYSVVAPLLCGIVMYVYTDMLLISLYYVGLSIAKHGVGFSSRMVIMVI